MFFNVPFTKHNHTFFNNQSAIEVQNLSLFGKDTKHYMVSEFRHYWAYQKVTFALSVRTVWSKKCEYSVSTTEATLVLNRKILWTELVNSSFRHLYPLTNNSVHIESEGWVGPGVGLDILETTELYCPCRKANATPSSRGLGIITTLSSRPKLQLITTCQYT